MKQLLSKLLFVSILSASTTAFAGGPIPVTILHTNDLHSHFRPDKSPLALGGLARLKTAIDQQRRANPGSVLVDGGDWSEGNIYYTEGAGREILKMMDVMGYDVAVVGNHDWLNGPDTLLDAVDAAQTKVSLVGANFDPSAYKRADEFRKKVLPFVIKDINGAKVAFIGLATYEFIYDKYIAPIKITEPFSLTRDLAKKLKKVVDAVVVISHNRVSYNKALLQAAPDVDLVIGAHDHVKLATPVVVTRPGATAAWVVETGCWGKYLGRVDIRVTPRNGDIPSKVQLVKYALTQMDRTVAEDPAINARISELEAAIEHRMGPVFTDHIADNHTEINREGTESPLGNFVTDAYRRTTGADIALDVKAFVYDSVHEGTVNSVDMYNSNPAIYNPRTGRNWTLKTMPIKGKTLQWIFGLLLFKNIPAAGALYTSGANILFNGNPKPALPINPVQATDVVFATTPYLFNLATGGTTLPDDNDGENPGDANSTIRQILIGGHAINDEQTYTLTGGGGIFETIEVINSMIPNMIPTDGIRDTGIEAWQAAADYMKSESPLTPNKVTMGRRVQTVQPDLGIYYDDVSWTPLKVQGATVTARVSVNVHNFGGTATPDSGPVLLIMKNKNGNNFAIDANYEPLVDRISIASLAPGESRVYEATVTVTPDRGVYGITALIRGNDFEVNHGNEDVTRYFSVPARGSRKSID